jgi:adenylyltransferase/sulfurtransferase
VTRDYSRLANTVFRREAVSNLTALVVGAGALGNEVIKNLALLGIGELWILDRDHVELSNLTRSILFCASDIEDHISKRTPKAELAASRVAEINPDVSVKAFVAEFADLGLGIVKQSDIVFSCLDNEMARLESGWASSRLNKPLVDGGLGWINSSSGLVSIFPGETGPCYACRKSTRRRRQLLQELYGREDPCWLKAKQQEEANMVSTTPLMSSAIAAFQVELGLRHWLNRESREDESSGRAFKVTLAPGPSLEQFSFERSPNCPLHEPESLIRDIIALENAKSASWTPRRLLDTVGGASLVLDWPYTARAKCHDCKHSWAPMIRRSRFRSHSCPECQSSLIAEEEIISEIDLESQWVDHTFSCLGLPNGSIYEVITGLAQGKTRLHVELSGDLRDNQ